MQRTALYIDIDAFSPLYGSANDSLWGLSGLMGGVFAIGTNSDRIGITRMFAHQIGDGFLLIDDGSTPSSCPRFLGVAIALSQFTLLRTSHFCKSALAFGDLADVTGCYPEEVRECARRGAAKLGDGVMTLFSVMGTALINAVKLNHSKGATIALDASQAGELPDEFLQARYSPPEKKPLALIDWIHSSGPSIARAREILGIEGVTTEQLVATARRAIAANGYDEAWIKATTHSLGI